MKFTNANSFKSKIKDIAKKKSGPSPTSTTAIFT